MTAQTKAVLILKRDMFAKLDTFGVLMSALMGIATFGSSVAHAAPITYTFTGTGTGTLGSTPFANAEVTITGHGDASLATSNWAGLCNDLASVLITVAGVGTAKVTDSLLIFDNQSAKMLGLSLGTCEYPVEDRFAMAHPQFAGYDLRQALGPVTAIDTTSGTMKPLNTASGLLYFAGPPFAFQATQSEANVVPMLTIHTSLVLILAVILVARRALGGKRRHRLSDRRFSRNTVA